MPERHFAGDDAMRGSISMEDVSDAELLERFVSRHDEAAFGEMMARHGPMVFGVCRRLLRHAQDAEDAFQATFLILVRKAASIGKRELLGNWLYGVAMRVAVRARAVAGKRRTQESADMERIAEMRCASAETTDLSAAITEEVQHLPAKYRSPVVLCYLEGRSNEEAAGEMRCPVGTIKTRLSRAREMLRKRLIRRGLALSTAAFSTVLLAETSAASLPPALIGSTLKAAMSFAAGDAAAGGLVSAQAVALTKGVLHTMFVTKMKTVAALVLVLTPIFGGVGLFAYHLWATEVEVKNKDEENIQSVRAADDKDAQTILDRAIKSLGGQEELSKVKAATWKVKNKSSSVGGDIEGTGIVTLQGFDHYRYAFELEFRGAKRTGVEVLAKDKGWRRIGDNGTRAMTENELAALKRTVYLTAAPMTLMPLKGKGFKAEAAGEKKVGDKPAIGLKITGPDGKDFTLFFDKASGLPVLLTAKIAVVGRGDSAMEATYADYKEFSGIKKATTIIWKRDGQKISESHITEFRLLDQVDPKTFAEPK